MAALRLVGKGAIAVVVLTAIAVGTVLAPGAGSAFAQTQPPAGCQNVQWISPGYTGPGDIFMHGEVDCYGLALEPGKTYVIETQLTGHVTWANGWVYNPPISDTVLDVWKVTQYRSINFSPPPPEYDLMAENDDRGPDDLSSRIEFTADSYSDFYVRVRGFGTATGGYTLSVSGGFSGFISLAEPPCSPFWMCPGPWEVSLP